MKGPFFLKHAVGQGAPVEKLGTPINALTNKAAFQNTSTSWTPGFIKTEPSVVFVTPGEIARHVFVHVFDEEGRWLKPSKHDTLKIFLRYDDVALHVKQTDDGLTIKANTVGIYSIDIGAVRQDLPGSAYQNDANGLKGQGQNYPVTSLQVHALHGMEAVGGVGLCLLDDENLGAMYQSHSSYIVLKPNTFSRFSLVTYHGKRLTSVPSGAWSIQCLDEKPTVSMAPLSSTCFGVQMPSEGRGRFMITLQGQRYRFVVETPKV